ncbi:ankycorbin-like [Hydractinia symbiolongicarpus]|uniref:ankycorbin-like n=1 Tax=Hydractinia symbiolongicarpus TaxID=13093 RepID=UPI002551BAAF|nr:ankycorbin-like [Hydractinia symbiolongicarpus]
MDIITAIKNLNFKVVAELLAARFQQNGNRKQSKKTSKEIIPLHVAAETGCVEMLKILLRYGEDIDSKNSEGVTALQVACQHGHYDAVRFLLQQGVKVNNEEKNMLKVSLNFVGGQYTKIKKLITKAEQEKGETATESSGAAGNSGAANTTASEDTTTDKVKAAKPAQTSRVRFERRERPIRQRSFDADAFTDPLDELSARRREALLIDAEKKKDLMGKRRRYTQRKHSVGRKL